jgi:hypothetical protein
MTMTTTMGMNISNITITPVLWMRMRKPTQSKFAIVLRANT